MKFHPGYLSKEFYDFEGKFFNQLQNINVLRWNAWRIVKTSLYFEALYSSVPGELQNSAKENKTGLLKLAGKAVVAVGQLALYWIQGKKKGTFIVTQSANKILKDASGFSYDQIVDGLIIKSGITDYLYVEIPGLASDSNVKPKIQAHFKEAHFRFIKIVIYKLFVSKKSVRDSAEKIALLFNKEFEKKDFKTSIEKLSNPISGFCADYIFYRFVFKIFRPELLITNDLMGSGYMAAALSCQIPILELQHGIMDEYYPQYLLHPKFLAIKKQLPIADKIGVFGQFHKDQLVAKGFWQEQEVLIVGRFELPVKSDLMPRFSKDPTLLFTSQGSLLLDQSLNFLKNLLEDPFKDFHIVIKLHPLEPEYCIAEYKKLESNRVTVVQNQFHISSLFLVCDCHVSFYSTTLIESSSLGILTFTICNSSMENGIYEVIGENHTLEKSLKRLKNPEDLINAFKSRNEMATRRENHSLRNYLYEPLQTLNALMKIN